MSAVGAPARFDRASQHRRVLIAKVHLAKKEMAMVDDDYRQLLFDTTGRMSAADCSEAELTAMVEEMKRRGFKPKPARRKAAATAADHPAARKARALWISLYQLGAIDNPAEPALEAFARRQLGVDKLQWANQAQAYKLIEALKAIGARHGWDQAVGRLGPEGTLKVLKLRLCAAILAKLKEKGLAAAEWSLGDAAWRLTGLGGPDHASPEFWAIGSLDALVAGLGRKLRGGRP